MLLSLLLLAACPVLRIRCVPARVFRLAVTVPVTAVTVPCFNVAFGCVRQPNLVRWVALAVPICNLAHTRMCMGVKLFAVACAIATSSPRGTALPCICH